MLGFLSNRKGVYGVKLYSNQGTCSHTSSRPKLSISILLLAFYWPAFYLRSLRVRLKRKFSSFFLQHFIRMPLLTEFSQLLRHERSFFRNDCFNRNYNALLFLLFFFFKTFIFSSPLRTPHWKKQLCRRKILPRLRKIFASSVRGVPDWGQRRSGRRGRWRDAKSGFKLRQHFAISSTTAGLKHGCWICFISGRHAAASPLPRPQPSGVEQERRGKRGRSEVLRLENREAVASIAPCQTMDCSHPDFGCYRGK